MNSLENVDTKIEDIWTQKLNYGQLDIIGQSGLK